MVVLDWRRCRGVVVIVVGPGGQYSDYLTYIAVLKRMLYIGSCIVYESCRGLLGD